MPKRKILYQIIVSVQQVATCIQHPPPHGDEKEPFIRIQIRTKAESICRIRMEITPIISFIVEMLYELPSSYIQNGVV